MTTNEFSELFKTYFSTMYKFALRLTRSQSDAKDLVQKAAIRAFQNKEKLDNPEKFKPWFSTILHNTFINDYRKSSRRKSLLESQMNSSAFFFNKSTVTNKGYEDLKSEDILKLTNKVGDKSLEAFFLFLRGYSYKEIAELLDIAVGTVKSRIFFARSKMQEITKEYDIAV